MDKRNLSDIPTDKLFDLFMKCFHQLNEESVDTVFHGTEELTMNMEHKVSLAGLRTKIQTSTKLTDFSQTKMCMAKKA